MESGEVAYSANTDGKAQYYLDTGASSHFIEEIGALYDYIPFGVHPLSSGTLKWNVVVECTDLLDEMAGGTSVKVIYTVPCRQYLQNMQLPVIPLGILDSNTRL